MDIHPTALKTQERLRAAGLDVEVQELAKSTRTAAEAAAAVDVEVGQIVKSLVFGRDGRDPLLGPILAVAAALALPLPTVPRLIEQAAPVYCGGARGQNVALSFDDGPSPYTQQLVRVLSRLHARATFFDVGSRIGDWPQAVREQTRVGEVGNHTASHPHLTGMAAGGVQRRPRW